MDTDSDRIPALRLTLEHYLPLAGGDWVRITGLALDGGDVVVALGESSSVRLPANRLVCARVAGTLGRAVSDATEERDVERRIAGWYGGDLCAVEDALHALAGPQAATRP